MGLANLARYGALAKNAGGAITPYIGGAGTPGRFANILNMLKGAGGWIGSHPMQTGAAMGATHGLATEGLGGIPGGAFYGGLSGMGMGGLGGPAGVARASNLLGRVGMSGAAKGTTAALLAPAAQIGATAAFGGMLPRLGGGVRDAAAPAGAIAAGRLTGSPNVNSGDVLGSGNLPPGTTARMIGPEGGVWYQLDPQGIPAGNRLGRQLGAMTDANVLNTLGDALYGQTERVAKSELARQVAGEQIKANIEQAKKMALESQGAGLKMGIDASNNMAAAMANRSNFRYL